MPCPSPVFSGESSRHKVTKASSNKSCWNVVQSTKPCQATPAQRSYSFDLHPRWRKEGKCQPGAQKVSFFPPTMGQRAEGGGDWTIWCKAFFYYTKDKKEVSLYICAFYSVNGPLQKTSAVFGVCNKGILDLSEPGTLNTFVFHPSMSEQSSVQTSAVLQDASVVCLFINHFNQNTHTNTHTLTTQQTEKLFSGFWLKLYCLY